MTNGIKPCSVTEGSLMAQKDQDDFGGPNMWRLHILTTDGNLEYIQWMHISKIQKLFKTKLPVYNEEVKKQMYSLKQ